MPVSSLRSSIVLLAALAACGNSTSPNYPSLIVRTTTTGVSLDPDGYTLAVARAGAGAGSFPTRLTRNGLLNTPRLPGTDSLRLGDLSPNCSVVGGSVRVVTLRDGDAADSARFDVTCARANGVLAVRTEFSAAFAGGNVTVVVDSGESHVLAPTDSTRFTDLADGVHMVMLTAPHFPQQIGPLPATVTKGIAPTLTVDSSTFAECPHPDPVFDCD